MSIATSLGLSSGDRLCFGGDSITEAHMYSHYLMAWFQLTYPSLNLDTFEIARSGSALGGWSTPAPVPPDVSSNGLYERYHYPFSPDVVFMMHGQNGGQTAEAHGATYADFWTEWIDGVSAAKLVCLGMHPVQAGTDTKHAEGKADEEAALAAGDARIWASHTFDHMGAQWLANSSNAIDVRQVGVGPFAGNTRDGVHPGPAGHAVIAWAVLQGLGAETVVSQAEISAASAMQISAANCTLSNITTNAYGGIDFDRLDGSLPWAIDEAGRANAVTLIPEIEGWQDYSMTISGLAAGTYDVICNGVTLGAVSHSALAAGWNMADLTSGPVWEKSQNVLTAIRALQGYTLAGSAISPNTGTVDAVLSNALALYQNGNQRGTVYYDNMQSVISALATRMAAVRTAAQPESLAFSLRRQGYTPAGPTTKRSRAHVARILAATHN